MGKNTYFAGTGTLIRTAVPAIPEKTKAGHFSQTTRSPAYLSLCGITNWHTANFGQPVRGINTHIYVILGPKQRRVSEARFFQSGGPRGSFVSTGYGFTRCGLV